MTTKYTFVMEDANGKKVTHEFTDASDTLTKPLEEYFSFLKGCGFLFNTQEELAVYNFDTGESRNGSF